MSRSSYAQLTDVGRARRVRALVPDILRQYDITADSIQQLAIHSNMLYRVRAGGEQYALRVQRPGLHSPAETELEMWWLQRLAAEGLPVAAVVPATDGGFVTSSPTTDAVPVEHRCELFEWLPGSEPDDEHPEFFERLGALAARLHDHAATVTIPAELPRRRWNAVMPYEEPILFESRFADLITPERRTVLQAGIERLDDELAAVYRCGDEPILLHGDLHNGNVRSSRGALSVFDFEDLIVGYPLHDIAVALYGSYYNAPDYPAFRDAMRQGYETVREWPLADDEALVPLFAARALGMVNFCLFSGGEVLDYVPRLIARVDSFLAM